MAQAYRFLAQSSMGPTPALAQQVQTQGLSGWVDAQLAMAPSTPTHLAQAELSTIALAQPRPRGQDVVFAWWTHTLQQPDQLRQRVAYALSQIFVVSISNSTLGDNARMVASYADMLSERSTGTFRELLEGVALHPAMGTYLTFRGNLKANTTTGALPDENYARELLQLFTIGLVQHNLDGTPALLAGQPQDTYGLDDITGLARVFTGWDWDTSGSGTTTPDYQRRPMVQVASRHEAGAARFLGATVPAGLDGAGSLTAALDILHNHPNVAPFISRQLIQRLVTSNPAPAYVQRVASVFLDDGKGVRGNLAAVVKAVLLDSAARTPPAAGNTSFGKVREPVLRFLAWGRAFAATSAADTWGVGDTSDPASRLGQSPLRSPSVFNFFRPGYVPPNSAVASAGLVAPELQLTNESSAVGYINFMQAVISNGIGDVKADYSGVLPLADDASALLDALNLLLAAGQLGAATLALLKTAVGGMPAGTAAARNNRLYAALVLVLAAPEFLVQQ